MVSPPLLTRICIAGGGSAGWMAAAALSVALRNLCRIELVESEEIGIVGVGEATIPPIKLFNQQVGVDEAAFLRATHGTIKLAIEFAGWGEAHSRYPHPFGAIGADFDRAPVFQHWLAAHRAGAPEPLQDYSFAWALARTGRFAPLSDDPRRIQSTHDYAYHFDAMLYGRYLRSVCEPRGVVRTEGRIEAVERDSTSGDVTALRLSDGRRVEADFFIDCTGFRGLLIEGALATGYDDWSRWLANDRAVAVPCAHGDTPQLPWTGATARDAGWQWRIPLQHRIGNGYVYCSDHISDDDALATLLGHLDGAPQAEPNRLRFTSGKRRRMWNRNVVALGLASGFMEPLESTSIHLVQAGISRLLKMLPAGASDPAVAAEFNRQSDFEWERIRDFIILHFKATERRDTAYWRDRAAMPIPDTLAAKIELFRAQGLIFREHEELFTESGWLQVLVGQGIEPRRWHPLAGGIGEQELAQYMAGIALMIDREVAEMESYDRFLAATRPTAGVAA